jgi:hypothetical protein
MRKEVMNPRHGLTLLLALFFAASAGAESFSGSIGFGATPDLQGVLNFTALAPGETSSSFGPFTGYSQSASSDYTYLYILENDSAAGTPGSFCNEHCFYGLDLETLFDPNGGGINSIGFDSSAGGEEPSFFDANTAPDLVFYEFDSPPNYGIRPDGLAAVGGVPGGDFSAILRFYSPFGPTDQGGAFITNNVGPPDDFFHILTGVTTPVPEPGSAALLGLGLLALAARRRS